MLGEGPRGLLVGKGGLYGNVLRIAPPMTLTEDEADEGLEILAHAFRPRCRGAKRKEKSPRKGLCESLDGQPPALVP